MEFQVLIINITKLSVSVSKFERKMHWKEIYAKKTENGKEEEEWVPDIFYKEKCIQPTKQLNRSLNNFLGGVRGEIMGTKPNESEPTSPKTKQKH